MRFTDPGWPDGGERARVGSIAAIVVGCLAAFSAAAWWEVRPERSAVQGIAAVLCFVFAVVSWQKRKW